MFDEPIARISLGVPVSKIIQNLARKSRAEAKGKPPVDTVVSRKAIVAQALDDLAGTKPKRLGRRERAKVKAEAIQRQVRVLEAQALPEIRVVSRKGSMSPWTPSVAKDRLLGATHTKGFHAPGMAKDVSRKASSPDRWSQAGFNAGQRTVYKDGRADPLDRPVGPTKFNRFKDVINPHTED